MKKKSSKISVFVATNIIPVWTGPVNESSAPSGPNRAASIDGLENSSSWMRAVPTCGWPSATLKKGGSDSNKARCTRTVDDDGGYRVDDLSLLEGVLDRLKLQY